MKSKITKFFLATLVALPVFGNEHDYSYSEFTPFGKYMDLREANFEAARIVGSGGQPGGNFVRANLTGANLRDANFSRVNLQEANLTGADLNGTDFTDAIFSSHTKWPAGFDHLTVGAHGPGVDYSSKEFLLNARHWDLKGTNFEGAEIKSTDFRRTNLAEANLRDANFSRVNLQEANLTGADLRGTDLSEIKHNSHTKWTGAIYSVHTKWPEGFDPRAAGAVLEWQSPGENPDGTGLVHYKQEYENARILLNQLKKQTELAKKNLIEKEAKVSSLGEKIEQGREILLSINTDLRKVRTEHTELLNELKGAKQILMARGEKVKRLKDELAQSVATESLIKLEIESEAFKLEEKAAEFAQVEAILATPHIKGWLYTPSQGWLFTEVGTYPLVFAEQSQSWLYYDQGTSAPWWYFNYSNETWIDWTGE